MIILFNFNTGTTKNFCLHTITALLYNKKQVRKAFFRLLFTQHGGTIGLIDNYAKQQKPARGFDARTYVYFADRHNHCRLYFDRRFVGKIP